MRYTGPRGKSFSGDWAKAQSLQGAADLLVGQTIARLKAPPFNGKGHLVNRRKLDDGSWIGCIVNMVGLHPLVRTWVEIPKRLRKPTSAGPRIEAYGGLYLTDAYNFEWTERFGRELWLDASPEMLAFTDEIPQALHDGRVQIRGYGSDGLHLIQSESYRYYTQWGLNFYTSTRYSGKMREFVQRMAGAGFKVSAPFGWWDTVGVFYLNNNNGPYWYIRINRCGVFYQPVTFTQTIHGPVPNPPVCWWPVQGQNLPDCASLTEEDWTSQNWHRIAPGAVLTPFYGTNPCSCPPSGWAFNRNGTVIRNTSTGFKSFGNEYNGATGLLFEITITMGQAHPEFGGIRECTELGSGEWGFVVTSETGIAPGNSVNGNYFFPTENDFSAVIAYNTPPRFYEVGTGPNGGMGEMWEGHTEPPYYTWFDLAKDEWITYRWFNYSQYFTIPPPGSGRGAIRRFQPKIHGVENYLDGPSPPMITYGRVPVWDRHAMIEQSMREVMIDTTTWNRTYHRHVSVNADGISVSHEDDVILEPGELPYYFVPSPVSPPGMLRDAFAPHKAWIDVRWDSVYSFRPGPGKEIYTPGGESKYNTLLKDMNFSRLCSYYRPVYVGQPYI